MRSLASASVLLAKCTNVRGTLPLLRELGFSSNLVPLAVDGARLLDIPQGLTDVHIAMGNGSLRALAFRISDELDERATLALLAARLSTRAPQLLFLLIALHRGRRSVAISAFDASHGRPRLNALVVRLENIVDSDSETICALASADRESDLLTHCGWLEILGRESISRRFFRELEKVIARLGASLNPPVAPSDASELALLYVSRLLFLSFLETKGWLDRDHAFLENHFARCMVGGGGYHRKVLGPLFFGTLNTRVSRRARRAREFGRIPFLNGGLFNKSRLEARASSSFFTDEALGDVFGDLLTRYRFTAREDGTSWTEAAVDPEMLGKAFEALMSRDTRKTSGAFYTPQALVREVSGAALRYGISGDVIESGLVTDALDGRIPSHELRAQILEQVQTVTVLDPACGSGAFLVHVLEELASLRLKLGDLRPLHIIRRDILTRSIFGVDINPMAVWLCELRLWLSMAIEDPESDPVKVAALPNLDRNIRVGDSLSGDAFNGLRMMRGGGNIARLRARYSRATGPRKRSLSKALDSAERICAVELLEQRARSLAYERREILVHVRSRDLFGNRLAPPNEMRDRLRVIRREIAGTKREILALNSGGALPFSFPSGFADVQASGGFGIVVGNPPWVRTHNMDARSRALLRQRFDVYRNSAWLSGSTAAGAGNGFASQVDAAALFVERSTDLLRAGGAMSLVLPAKLWHSLAGGGVRNLLLGRVRLREFHDLSDGPSLFDAAVYPSVVVASRSDVPAGASSLTAIACKRGSPVRWRMNPSRLPLDDSRGSPWIVVPGEVRAAFERIRVRGTALSRTRFGRPLLGVKTGCNEAFVVSGDCAVEASLLRPVIRGDQVRPWIIGSGDRRIIWTHDNDGPMALLPPGAARWLAPWRRELEQRSDFRSAAQWWSLFRTESARFDTARVVWSDIGKRPRAAVLLPGDDSVPINTCYVARCADVEDAQSLAAVLNSTLAASWLSLIAEPARGGYMRYMGWTMAMLPLPTRWNRARDILVPIAESAMDGQPPTDLELLDAVCSCYGLAKTDIDKMLEWSR